MLFVALCMFLLGAMLYLTIITLIFYRFTFVPLTMEQLTPPYWINMGAVAITTLAGASLLSSQAELWPFLAMLRPFVAGFTLFFWATATWWIPLLLILGVWRHVVRRYPAALRPAVLGHGVSARHVHRLHGAARTGDRARRPASDSAGHRVRRAGGLGDDVRRHVSSPVERRAAEAFVALRKRRNGETDGQNRVVNARRTARGEPGVMLVLLCALRK